MSCEKHWQFAGNSSNGNRWATSVKRLKATLENSIKAIIARGGERETETETETSSLKCLDSSLNCQHVKHFAN